VIILVKLKEGSLEDDINSFFGSVKKASIMNAVLEISDHYVFSGTVNISKPVIVKKGATLEVLPDTKVVFAPGAMLYSLGGSVIAQGTKEKPIK